MTIVDMLLTPAENWEQCTPIKKFMKKEKERGGEGVGGEEWECILSSQSSRCRCFGLKESQKFVLGRGEYQE